MNIDPAALADLRSRLRGPLLLAGEPGYDDARSLWNAMIDRRPGAIARCLGTADVLQCVAFARERGVELAIKGGGHNIAGLALCDGGLVVEGGVRGEGSAPLLMRHAMLDEWRIVIVVADAEPGLSGPA